MEKHFPSCFYNLINEHTCSPINENDVREETAGALTSKSDPLPGTETHFNYKEEKSLVNSIFRDS